MSEFFNFPSDITLWSLLNSNAVAAIIAAYATIVATKASERSKAAKNDANTAQIRSQDAEKVATEAEAASGVAKATLEANKLQSEIEVQDLPDDINGAYRDRAAELYRKTDAYLRSIAESAKDGRHRRTFEGIRGGNIAALAVALRDRNLISDQENTAAQSFIGIWNKYATGKASRKPVSEAVFNAMNEQYAIIVKAQR